MKQPPPSATMCSCCAAACCATQRARPSAKASWKQHGAAAARVDRPDSLEGVAGPACHRGEAGPAFPACRAASAWRLAARSCHSIGAWPSYALLSPHAQQAGSSVEPATQALVVLGQFSPRCSSVVSTAAAGRGRHQRVAISSPRPRPAAPRRQRPGSRAAASPPGKGSGGQVGRRAAGGRPSTRSTSPPQAVAVGTQAHAVHRQAEQRLTQVALGDHGGDVRMVVLHGHHRQAAFGARRVRKTPKIRRIARSNTPIRYAIAA